MLHIGTLKQGTLSTGSEIKCEVDYERRVDISKSHTLTHVINLALHQVQSRAGDSTIAPHPFGTGKPPSLLLPALSHNSDTHPWNTSLPPPPLPRCSHRVRLTPRRALSNPHSAPPHTPPSLTQVLGDGVSQKGSLVDETKARFDFSHGKAMTAKECATVEALVQEQVAESMPVHIETVPLDKALAINNLRAVFGERYPDPVRGVSRVGPSVTLPIPTYLPLRPSPPPHHPLVYHVAGACRLDWADRAGAARGPGE